MNRRKTVEVLAVELPCVSSDPMLSSYERTTGKAWISATHLRSTLGNRWYLRAACIAPGGSVVSSDAEAVTLAAAEDQLRERVRNNSYLFRAMQEVRAA